MIAFRAKLLSAHPQCYPSVGVIEGWEFPWVKPVLRTEPMSESETVREQGGWVLTASIANSVLGFGFWALAAHLFSSGAVGIAGALVSLSSLATSIGILGLDNGLVRFATRVDRPRALMWELLLIGGTLSAIVGLALSATVLTLSAKDLRVPLTEQQFVVLVLLTVVLTGSQTSFQITDGSILAARRSQYLAFRAVAYGLVKILLLFALVEATVVGLFGAYTLPLFAVTLVSFFLVRRVWPVRNETGVPHRFREVASLSFGNWISGLAYSLPTRLAAVPPCNASEGRNPALQGAVQRRSPPDGPHCDGERAWSFDSCVPDARFGPSGGPRSAPIGVDPGWDLGVGGRLVAFSKEISDPTGASGERGLKGSFRWGIPPARIRASHPRIRP